MRKFGTAILLTILTISISLAQTPADTSKKTVAAQPQAPAGPRKVLDKIAAVVGGSIILQSDIELQYANYLASGNPPDPSIKCIILRNQMTQKLLAQQAVIDS